MQGNEEKSLAEVMVSWARRSCELTPIDRTPKHVRESRDWEQVVEHLSDASQMLTSLSGMARHISDWAHAVRPWDAATIKSFMLPGDGRIGVLNVERNGREFTIHADRDKQGRWEWRCEGATSRLDIMELTGWPEGYIEGLFDAWDLLEMAENHWTGQQAGKLYELELAKQSYWVAAEALQLAFGGEPSFPVVQEFISNFDILTKIPTDHLDATELARRIKAERVVEFVDSQCASGPLPPPPAPETFARNVAAMQESFGGVYFAWEGGICVYVGRSKNIPKRIRSHHVVQPEMELSWLEFDEIGQHWNEMYYIGLLRPDLNFGGKKTEYAAQ